MNDVLVVNLNLAVDKTAVIRNFKKSRIYRLDGVKTLPGGKGVNVARALKSLGTSSRLLGFVAGHNGRWIAENLALEGLDSVCVPYGPGESRVCYSVVDEKDGVSTDFNEEGPVVPPGARHEFVKQYRRLLGDCKAVALCGRISAGLKKDFYGGLVKMAGAAGKISARHKRRGSAGGNGLRRHDNQDKQAGIHGGFGIVPPSGEHKKIFRRDIPPRHQAYDRH